MEGQVGLSRMKINILSTYISPPPNTIEEKINDICKGSHQLRLMANSLRIANADISQYVLTNSNIRLTGAHIENVKDLIFSNLTMEIIRFQRDFFESACGKSNWICCDPDFLFFDDISSVFDADFDVAMTVRNSSNMPYNSGIFFIKDASCAHQFYKLQFEIIKNNFMDNAQWFGDQLVLKYIIDNADYDKENDYYIFEGLRIKLLDADVFNYSPNREHPNLLVPPKVKVYHFKGRCRSYMKYFYKHYVDNEDRSVFWWFFLFIDFLRAESERKRLKHIYEAATIRHRPK